MADINYRGETQLSSPYGDLSGYGSALDTLFNQLVSLHSDSTQARQGLTGRLDSAVNQFKSSFTNLVGRDPSQDEINTFLSQNAGSTITNSANGLGRSEQDPTGVLNSINQYVGQNFQKTAKDYATSQLQDQAGQAQTLADQYRSMGNTAISDTENSLLDYQSKLFDRLRPNLLTSLKAQGLLDTGGMNEAMAGVQGDLANSASNYVAGLKYQNDTNANQIAFGGASAPYYYKQGLITQQPQDLINAGQAATTFNNNVFNSNLDYQHQLQLLAQQNKYTLDSRPSFLRTMGQSTATSLGNSFGQWFSPGAGNSNQSGGGSNNYSNLMKLVG